MGEMATTYSTASNYRATFALRVSQAERAKSKTAEAWQVPSDRRPHVEKTRGIEIFPQDYETLDFETFVRMFGGGQRTSLDPFQVQYIDFKAGNFFIPGPGRW